MLMRFSNIQCEVSKKRGLRTGGEDCKNQQQFSFVDTDIFKESRLKEEKPAE